MNCNIVILTPTYNRPEGLYKLFESLKEQDDLRFSWMIVNDGSLTDVSSIVKNFISKELFHISYYEKENGGKSSAINYALDMLGSDDFVLIVDDDEVLYKTAIGVVRKYVDKYINSDIGMIDFNRSYSDGRIIGAPLFEKDYIMTVQERRKKNIYSDGYTGYFVSHIGNKRFPIYNGERYVGPSVLSMMVSLTSKILWAQPVLGGTEYLEGGLTKQGRKLRLKSPRGMACYCMLMQAPESGFSIRFLYSILYHAYLKYARIEDYEIDVPYVLILNPISKCLGYLLSWYWKLKY